MDTLKITGDEGCGIILGSPHERIVTDNYAYFPEDAPAVDGVDFLSIIVSEGVDASEACVFLTREEVISIRNYLNKALAED